MIRSQTLSNRMADYIILFFLVIIALISLYPMWYTVAISLSDKAAATAGKVTAWPIGFNLESYRIILGDEKFFRAFVVSVKRVILGGALNFLLTVIMAYPLSREIRQFPARNFYMWYLVFCMLFSGGLIPLYMTVTTLGLQNTIWSLVLPGAVPIFSVILIMNFFRSLPKELDEAAEIDGAGPWYALMHIYIPLSLPAMATVTLFSIVGHWNAFFDGLIFMSKPENYPLQTYIQQLVFTFNSESGMSTEQMIAAMKTSDKTLNAAKLMVAMIPILIIYPFMQRYFVHGIVMGSVKE
ncbi:ABC transporter permease subunit [Paenibacillus sp. LMG 31458]|uniref:ABC transporter permease subunit n=1 Tax=Paenibacillus phytorum TaxID=2654977 RepID=A0ABX1XXA9_9BACL|nr:carbohydrate ABC transporter permease [Paenibacillus phytorum]NOU73187.1 ABC transporter permease subunit [Paenibacillus phytorum]